MRQREGNRYFCFRLRPLKLITGWVLSVPYKVPLLQEFAHDTVSDGGEGKKIKSDTVSTVSPSICHEVMGPDAMILVF